MKKEDKQNSKIKEAANAMKSKKKYFAGVGYRKRAIASVRLYEAGSGEIMVNGKSAADYFQEKTAAKIFLAPLKLVGVEKKYDMTMIIRGGGKKAQLIAARHGLARALNIANPQDHKSLKKEGYLTRDPREKERKKPGLKRARKAPQWAKR